jgi:hypothetical protein
MIPTEIRESLPGRMAALGISALELARLASWSQSQLSGFLAGKRTGMRLEKILRLHQTVVDLENLAARVAPLPLSFRNAEIIRSLLAQSSEEFVPKPEPVQKGESSSAPSTLCPDGKISDESGDERIEIAIPA